MKKLYLIIILVISSRFVTAQFVTQYFDGADTAYENSVNVFIESDSLNIWQIGPPQKSIFNGAASVPNAIVTDTVNYYPDNNISRFRIEVLNQFMPFGIFALQWKQKLDMDTNADGGIIEFSTDDGVSWQNAFNNPLVYNFYGFQPANQDTLNTGEYAFSGTDTSWADIWLCFDLSWMSSIPDTIDFRFTLKSDSINNNKEGWLIDNMMAHPTFIHVLTEAPQKEYLRVYPNPAESIITIEAKKLLEYHIIELMELIDAQGKIVKSWKNLPTKYWFDVRKFANGQYYLKVKTNLRTETFPVVISKH